jgi:hypothetical protein
MGASARNGKCHRKRGQDQSAAKNGHNDSIGDIRASMMRPETRINIRRCPDHRFAGSSDECFGRNESVGFGGLLLYRPKIPIPKGRTWPEGIGGIYLPAIISGKAALRGWLEERLAPLAVLEINWGSHGPSSPRPGWPHGQPPTMLSRC